MGKTNLGAVVADDAYEKDPQPEPRRGRCAAGEFFPCSIQKSGCGLRHGRILLAVRLMVNRTAVNRGIRAGAGLPPHACMG